MDIGEYDVSGAQLAFLIGPSPRVPYRILYSVLEVRQRGCECQSLNICSDLAPPSAVPNAWKAGISTRAVCRYNCKVRLPIYISHVHNLGYFVFFIVLNYAKAVHPEVSMSGRGQKERCGLAICTNTYQRESVLELVLMRRNPVPCAVSFSHAVCYFSWIEKQS